MRSLSMSLLILMVGVSWFAVVAPKAVQAAPSIWAPPPLAQIIEEGLAQNKKIQSLAAQVASLKEEIPFAGSLDDPRLGIGVLNLPADTFRSDQEAMTQKQLFIAQKIPWFGKLSLRSQRAALRASRQEAILAAKRLELARQIATTYYELGFIASSQEINERLTSMVNQVLRKAEIGYAAGRGLQQDVLQAQVELSKLLNEKIMLERKRRTLEDRINELLNRESFTPVQPPRDMSYPDMSLRVEALQAQALRQNPWLRVRQAEVDQAGIEIELARKDYLPDMDFKVAYGQRDQDWADFVSASVVINIPLWQKSRQDKKLAATEKSHEAAMRSYRNLVEALPHRVDALATEILTTQENYRLFADALMVQAEQWARSSVVAYEVGKVDFSTMINAQIRLLSFELQADSYLFSIYQKRAELEEVLGGPLLPQGVSDTSSH